ncbi:MAG: DeoR/GlpR transcriptional regulator [Acidobacteria bacterium]|nr:DeoR/GlpR transcriptional regulator [Acidobacteriota bacterium]
MLQAGGRVTIPQIVEKLGVSAVTARGDLDNLAERRLLSRSHGGAIQNLDPSRDYPVRFKETVNHRDKVRIAQRAMDWIQPGATIILDSGSTTEEIAKLIREGKTGGITVITNAMNIAEELAPAPGVTVLMLGGLLRPISLSFAGPQAEHMLRQLRADYLFLGVDGLDAEAGASTPDILEAQLNGLMMEVARQVTIVTDKSKLGRRSLSVIGRLEMVHRVITTGADDDATLEALRSRGIEVVMA